ncbi:MAG TPA: hypothetical protein VMZ92_01965 [Planctomycetota bacterium]|nr:hypothetical protein [Planctomycetota bacterium]
MRFRERRGHEDDGGNGNEFPGPGDGNLDRLRDAGRELLRRGDEAVNNALSRGDSEKFLSAIRQQGGE